MCGVRYSRQINRYSIQTFDQIKYICILFLIDYILLDVASWECMSLSGVYLVAMPPQPFWGPSSFNYDLNFNAQFLMTGNEVWCFWLDVNCSYTVEMVKKTHSTAALVPLHHLIAHRFEGFVGFCKTFLRWRSRTHYWMENDDTFPFIFN